MSYSKLMKRKGIKAEVHWWRDRWRKKKNGKMKYFAFPDTKDGYSQAVAAYHNFLQSLKPTRAHEATYRNRLSVLHKMEVWFKRFGEPEDELGVEDQLNMMVSRIELELTKKKLQPIHFLTPDGNTYDEKSLLLALGEKFFEEDPWEPSKPWIERVRVINAISPKSNKQTVGFWSDVMKADWDDKFETNSLEQKTVNDYKEKLDYFIDLIGASSPVESLERGPLNMLHKSLMKRIKEKKMKGRRGNNITKLARRFVRFCWRKDECKLETLPKAVDDPDLLFANDDSEVSSDDLWTIDDLKIVFQKCPIRYRAFMMLGFNCGFRNSDCSKLMELGKARDSSLKKYGVNLKSGRLIWRRPKTKRFKPPTVNYNLWDVTIDLLKATRGEDSEYWFSSEAGGRLVYDKTDLIGTGWQNLKNKPNKTLESCRDTGTTLISEKIKFKSARVDQLFLGHRCTIADQHYNAHDGRVYPPMDKAMDYLGRKLKVGNLRRLHRQNLSE